MNYYELFDKGTFMGRLTSREIAKITGCRVVDVYRICSIGNLYRRRWRIMPDGWSESWKEWCRRIKQCT